MDRVIIEGVNPYDGAYDLDLDAELTTREWGWIKRLAGYLPLNLTDEAFGDPEFACVLAAIAIRRAGRIQASEVPAAFEKLADAPFGAAIRIEGEPEPDQEEGAGPDPTPASSTSNGATSGDGSPRSSETPAASPPPTGTRASATSVSGPVTWGT